jgi:hypothetical protein
MLKAMWSPKGQQRPSSSENLKGFALDPYGARTKSVQSTGYSAPARRWTWRLGKQEQGNAIDQHKHDGTHGI